MAVVHVEELWPGRGGKDGIEKKFTHTRIFEVKTDDPADDEMTAGAAEGLPRNGDAHPNNDRAAMIDIDCQNSDDDPTLWLVVCTYSTEIPGNQARETAGYDPTSGASIPTGGGGEGTDPYQRAENPLDRPATYRVDWESTTEICTEGTFGAAIKNSAGDPFDPPPQVEVSYPVITIEKNYPIGDPILNLDVQDEYQDAVNLDAWHGIDAGKCRFVGLNVIYGFENGVRFGRVTFRIKIRKKGWLLRLVDCGFREFVPGSLTPPPADKMEPIRDEHGVEVAQPVPLDGAGRKLTPGAALVYLEFSIYTEKLYAPLGL